MYETEIKTAQDLIDYIQRTFSHPNLAGVCLTNSTRPRCVIVSKCFHGMLGRSDHAENLVFAFNNTNAGEI